MSNLLEIRDLSVQFDLDRGPVRVLEGVSLAVKPGQMYGIVGESGSGKSVLLRAVLGLLSPPWRIISGRVLFREEDLLTLPETRLEDVRGKMIALMVSNPRQHLNPVMPVGRQIGMIIQKHQKLSKAAAAMRSVALLKAVGLPDPASRYHSFPHELSGGMCQRIIIAMGLANSPELILSDEPTSGLDVTISMQILDLMRQSVEELNSALLLVSRDLGVIANYCQRVSVIYAGQVVEEAGIFDFFDQPVHPYSRHLIRAAEAARDPERAKKTNATSTLQRSETGCRYANRCPIALDACRAQVIELAEFSGGHLVRCIRKGEIISGELQP